MQGAFFFLSGQIGRISEGGANILRLERGILFENRLFRFAGRQVVENDRNHNARAFNTRLSMADFRVYCDSLMPVHLTYIFLHGNVQVKEFGACWGL